jgi:hypothetical protein
MIEKPTTTPRVWNCRRCGDRLDVLARAAGSPVCSACAFRSGDLHDGTDHHHEAAA